MKKISITALASVMLMACSQSEKTSYTITGHIDGLPDSSEVILIPLSLSGSDTIASSIVSDGHFSFNGTTEEPIAVNLIVKDHYGRKTFMLENADISISGSVSASEVDGGKLNFNFENVNINGSAMTDSFNIKMAGRHRLDSMFHAHHIKFEKISNAAAQARVEKNSARLDSIYATDEYKAMAADERYLFSALDSNYTASVKANSNTFWGPLLMISQVTYLTPEQRELYEKFSDEAKQSYYGRIVYDELYPVGAPGDKMPAFDAVTIDGSNTSLSSLCKYKKYIILDFWASWCGPCKREIPNLKNIYADFADKGFDIVSISIDQEDDAWRNAVKAEDLKWINIRDTDHSIADKYKVSSVPTMYIVDSKGRLVAENLRGEELAAKVKELMTE